ncbi:hypothetical protein V5081_22775, partial [Enterobacter cancerogenus]|uniref:hypothetical protein n=1 Tax=Enterobacter cancerogenus TaxID=69218 RepID=UPI003076167E
ARDLTALGHILGIKTHDVGPVVCAVTLAAKAKYSGVAGNPLWPHKDLCSHKALALKNEKLCQINRAAGLPCRYLS